MMLHHQSKKDYNNFHIYTNLSKGDNSIDLLSCLYTVKCLNYLTTATGIKRS